MERITRTIGLALTLWGSILSHCFAECTDSHLESVLDNSNSSILEGAMQKSQGLLFSAEQEIHCLKWKPSQIERFLYLNAIYAHLHKEEEKAQKYFLNRNPNEHTQFGIDLVQYASYFQQNNVLIPITIHRSHFQSLWLDGRKIENNHLNIKTGYHLLQLFDKKASPIHAQWIYVDKQSPTEIRLPRLAPKWMLYFATSQIALGGFSTLMKWQEENNMEIAVDEKTYRNAERAHSFWTTASISFFVVGITSYGIYFVW